MAINSELYKDAGIERNRFIVSGMLQMDLVMEKGYLLSFNFNKSKKTGIREISYKGKRILEVVV